MADLCLTGEPGAVHVSKPRTAKRLYFDVIPRQVDEYYQHLAAYAGQDAGQRLQNPVWHIHSGNPPPVDMPISFSMLLNLVSASNAHEKSILWGFISAHLPGVTAQNHPELDRLVGYAIRYFEDFVAPTKKFRRPDAAESAALADLDGRLGKLAASADIGADAEAIQAEVFEAGKKAEYANLREWFRVLYQVLLGQDQGPRFGSFVAFYGIERTRKLIERSDRRQTGVGYWLAQMMRAIHSISSVARLRSGCAGLRETSSTRRADWRASTLAITSPERVLTTTRSPLRVVAPG